MGKVAAAELRSALKRSVALQSHYAKLLNMYDGGERMQFAGIDEWLARLREVDARARERADLITHATPQQVGMAIARTPAEAQAWAVRFEALASNEGEAGWPDEAVPAALARDTAQRDVCGAPPAPAGDNERESDPTNTK